MWRKTLLASIVYPKMSCELSCMSNDISCSFLDLAINQCPQGIANTIGEGVALRLLDLRVLPRAI